MKVLIADKLSTKTISALEALGAKVTCNPDLSAEDLPKAVGDAEVLIVRSTKVSGATIKAAPSLSLIIRAGAGVNTIDLPTASSLGIHVANCPGMNTDAVAELALGLIIAADRRIVNASCDLRAGKWRKKEYGKAAGLKGRTLGIVGLGSIGTALANMAKGLNMKVIAWSRSLTPAKAEAMGIGYCATPLEVAEKSDVVSVHVAASKDTNGLIGQEFFDRMKTGAIFVNTSRGEVVNTQAMKAAIEKKKLRVGLDVFEGEPAPGEAPFEDTALAALVSATPHVGASTDQASDAIADEVVRVVQAYKETGKPLNYVNIRERSTARVNLVVRHYNRVGVIAGVLEELRNAGINIEEMDNLIFDGGAAASCTLRLDDEPAAKVIEKIRTSKDVIQAMLK